MNTVKVIIKIVAALAAIAGIVYVVATYGDKIVAWAKKLLGCCPSEDAVCVEGDCEFVEDAAEDVAPVEDEAPAEEAPAADAATVVASESDFEG